MRRPVLLTTYLAHVDESLSDSDDKESVLIVSTCVLAGEVTQILSQFRVVGASTCQTKSKDGAHGDVLILIVGQLGQKIHRGDFRVRDSEQTDC